MSTSDDYARDVRDTRNDDRSEESRLRAENADLRAEMAALIAAHLKALDRLSVAADHCPAALIASWNAEDGVDTSRAVQRVKEALRRHQMAPES